MVVLGPSTYGSVVACSEVFPVSRPAFLQLAAVFVFLGWTDVNDFCWLLGTATADTPLVQKECFSIALVSGVISIVIFALRAIANARR